MTVLYVRTCWISQMWANSPQHDVMEGLPLPEHSGWRVGNDGQYEFDWESEEVQQRFKHTIDFLTRGCSCKKRQCHKKSGCGCVRNSRYCGPGCECQSCVNVPTNDHESEHDASGEENDDSGEENEDGIELGGNSSIEEEDNTIIIDEEIITDWDDLFIPL